MAEVNFGDGSGTAVIGGVISYLASGGSVGTLISSTLVGVFLSPLVATIDVINAVTGFLTQPFDSAASALGSLVSGFFVAPGDLLTTGGEVSEQALSQFLGDSLAGLLGLPVAFGIVFFALFLLSRYLNEEETSNILPGIGFDVPFFGRDEEEVADE